MPNMSQLAEQHIRQHESHLKHIDELFQRAHKGASPEDSGVQDQLAALKLEQEKLASHFEELKQKSVENWQEEEVEKSGPLMGLWDAVAQELEKLVERVER